MVTRPTIKDVARLAGVSTATVSHVINNAGSLRQETRSLVRLAVQRLNYVPNIHARNLASGNSRTLGLILSDISDPFSARLFKAIQNRALELGFEVLLASLDHHANRLASCTRRLMQSRVCGIIVMADDLRPGAQTYLSSATVPTVCLNFGKVAPRSSNIEVNYHEGMRKAIVHLMRLGHRRIAVATPRNLSERVKLQLRAFFNAVKTVGTDPLSCIHLRCGSSKGDVASTFLSRSRPTAIIATSDLLAAHLLTKLKGLELRIPSDVSTIGHDNTWIARLTDPALTSMDLSPVQIGNAAVEAVLVDSQKDQCPGQNIEILTSLVLRRSTAPPPPHVQ